MWGWSRVFDILGSKLIQKARWQHRELDDCWECLVFYMQSLEHNPEGIDYTFKRRFETTHPMLNMDYVPPSLDLTSWQVEHPWLRNVESPKRERKWSGTGI